MRGMRAMAHQHDSSLDDKIAAIMNSLNNNGGGGARPIATIPGLDAYYPSISSSGTGPQVVDHGKLAGDSKRGK